MTEAVLSGLRVLVVEDEFLIASQITRELEAAGAEIAGPALSESAAFDILEREAIDAVTLDLNLDGKMPLELAQRLTDDALPFVVLSGYGQRQLDHAVLEGAPRLSKPAPPRQLVRVLEALICDE